MSGSASGSVPSLGGFPHLSRLPSLSTAEQLGRLPEFPGAWGIYRSRSGLVLVLRSAATREQLERADTWERKYLPPPLPFRQ